MGFLSAMKGANNNWGVATGDFGVGYIGPKNMVDNRSHELMISGTSLKSSIVFKKEDVESAKIIVATSSYIKIKLCLKSGFQSILTIVPMENDMKAGAKPSMALSNMEWWLSGILYE